MATLHPVTGATASARIDTAVDALCDRMAELADTFGDDFDDSERVLVAIAFLGELAYNAASAIAANGGDCENVRLVVLPTVARSLDHVIAEVRAEREASG